MPADALEERILACLREQGTPVSEQVVARALGLAPQAVRDVLHRLTDQGLLHRFEEPSQRGTYRFLLRMR